MLSQKPSVSVVPGLSDNLGVIGSPNLDEAWSGCCVMQQILYTAYLVIVGFEKGM